MLVYRLLAQAMKFIFDFFPIVLFFIAYKLYGLEVATGVAIVASFLQMIIHRVQHQRFETMHVVSFTMIGVLGGATLLLHDPIFIQFKPTAVYWATALVFSLSALGGRKSLVERLLEGNVALPHVLWQKLNWAWVAFFTCMGFANVIVAYFYSLDTWVYFKLFGGLGALLLFIMGQAVFLGRYFTEPKQTDSRVNLKDS